MGQRILLYIVLVIFLPLDHISSEPKRPTHPNVLLKKYWVAHTKVGRGSSIEDLYKRYGRDRVRLVDLNKEGFFTPALQVYINSEMPAFIAEIHWRRRKFEIDSITVYARSYMTAKGIGVGSTLGELRQHYVIDEIFYKNRTFANVPELAMGFHLDVYSDRVGVPSEWDQTGNPALLPDHTPIIAIWVRGD